MGKERDRGRQSSLASWLRFQRASCRPGQSVARTRRGTQDITEELAGQGQRRGGGKVEPGHLRVDLTPALDAKWIVCDCPSRPKYVGAQRLLVTAGDFLVIDVHSNILVHVNLPMAATAAGAGLLTGGTPSPTKGQGPSDAGAGADRRRRGSVGLAKDKKAAEDIAAGLKVAPSPVPRNHNHASATPMSNTNSPSKTLQFTPTSSAPLPLPSVSVSVPVSHRTAVIKSNPGGRLGVSGYGVVSASVTPVSTSEFCFQLSPELDEWVVFDQESDRLRWWDNEGGDGQYFTLCRERKGATLARRFANVLTVSQET